MVVKGAEPKDTAAPAQRAATYQVGDIITIGDSAVVVLGWDRHAGNHFDKPQEGKSFVSVDVLVANQGEVPISVAPLLQMSLKDSTDQRYVPDLAAGVAASVAPELRLVTRPAAREHRRAALGVRGSGSDVASRPTRGAIRHASQTPGLPSQDNARQGPAIVIPAGVAGAHDDLCIGVIHPRAQAKGMIDRGVCQVSSRAG